MKRILVGLVIGLLLLETGRRLYRPADEAAAAGGAAYRAGDFTTAEARFHEAEREASDKAPAAHNRAAALYKLRRFDDADHSYQRSADDEALHAARADYDRGNCAFAEACKDEGTADPEGLQKAARQYEACLAREGNSPAAGPLFDDARHNLELTRLILSEYSKQAAEGEKSEADKPEEVAKDDPFAPSNSANPPAGADGQQQPKDDAAKGKPKDEKPSETLAKNDANKPETRACKDCEKGGCPKCKKNPGKGPGPNEAPRKGDGPKPNPGKDENGKAPGKAKSQDEAKHDDPGPGKKGKPGDGGKPNPKEKNGIGHTTEPGTGPVEPGTKPEKKDAPSQGKKVGPDGVIFEPDDKDKKPSKGGKGGGDDASEEMKEPQPGGKNGSAPGAPGEEEKPRAGKDQPPPPPADKPSKPAAPRPNDRPGAGQGGGGSGQVRNGAGKDDSDGDETEGSGDPRERAAARRLRQAIQRIEKSRDARPAPAAPGKGEPPDPDRRRDW